MKKHLLCLFYVFLLLLPVSLLAQTAPTFPAIAGITSTSFSADWSAATGSVTNYTYDVATDNAFTNILVAYNSATTTSTGVNVTGLTAGTTYYFRVKTVNSSGSSAYTTAISTTTLTGSNFLANYDFNGASGTSNTDGTPPPSVNNLTLGTATLTGGAASAGAGRFAGNTWGTSTTIDVTKYYSVTLTPTSGYTFTLSSLTFAVQRSSTGCAKYSVRSSLDNFAADLPGTVTSNANLTVTSGVFSNSNTSAKQVGSGITLGASFAGLSSAITFRIYPFNASNGTSGAFSVDDINFTGTTTAAADVTPPSNTSTYPKTANLASTSVDVVSNLDEAGTTYYVLSPAATAAPTITQIMAGQDGTGAAALKSGSFAVTANTDASATITGLTASTAYKIYVVSKDAAGTPNVQTSFTTLPITTSAPPADVTPPVNATNYPKANNATPSSIDVVSNLNEIGTTYYVVLPTTGTAPTTSAQVKAGQDGNGNAVTLSGSFAVATANADATKTVSGLTASTAYKVYVVSEDGIPNLQTAFSTLSISTTADVTPPVNATNYPKANNVTSTTVDVVSNLNETGTTYYVVIPTSGTAPTTVAQVKAGQDGNGNTATASGSFSVPTANTDATKTITGLTASTAYNIYVVSQDAAGTPNLQAAFSTLNATTTAPPAPAIGTTGTLTLLITASGTASPNTSFSVSGANMTEGILVTAPSGFEVSTVSTSGFANSITVGAAGTIASTTVFVRLAAADAANTYSGNVVLTSSGATTVNVATVSSTVTPLPILAWDFGPDASNTNATHATTTSDANLVASTLSRGAGLTASGLAGGFSSSNFTMNGDLADAIANNKYYQFTIGANAGKAVSLSTLDANLRRSSTGPNAYQWQYSLDGTNFNNIGSPVSYTSTNTNGDPQTQIVLSGISALQNVASGTAITFRLYAYGATATGGTFAFGKPTQPANDLAITGTIGIAPPTVSYATPQTYLQNTAITALTPTSANVAAPAFSTNAVGTAFAQPLGVARDASGNIYIADAGASSVYKMAANGTGLTTIGSGIAGLGAIVLDVNGNMYVTEVTTGKLKKVTPGGVVTDITGAGVFTQPTGVVLDASGNIFVADQATNLVSEILSGGNTPATIASGFSTPFGLTIDASGNLYVANQGNGKLQKIDATTHTVTDVVTLSPGLTGLTLDGAGNFYYTNAAAHTVNEIPQGTITPTLLSSGFTTPGGIVIDATGNAYVADAINGGSVKKVARTGGYYITPALPAGLSMDGTTGAISGTPTAASVATNYTVTGFNSAGGTSTTVNITVTPQPAIGTTGTLSALNTTYGSASSNGTFSVSGTNLTAGVLVTPPAGFEVSTDGIAFTGTVTVGAAGTVASTPVYIRLAANNALNSYSGNVVLTSSGANAVNVATVSSTISAAPLTITANNVTKTVGTAITGGPNSTSFTSSGLKNSETIGSVTITYGTGSAAGAPAATYTGSVVPSAATGGTFTASNYSITYTAGDIIVSSAPTPTIGTTGTLSALTATYGTASASGTFNVSGVNMAAGILVTPPAGFEVSTDNVTFSSTVTVGAAGTIASTPVYIRLLATVAANIYSGNVVLSSTNAVNANVATTASTVGPAAITITAKAASKTYGQTLSNTVSSTLYTLTGTLKNGETISDVTITYGTGAAATDGVNTYTGTVVPGSVTGANGFLTSNYSITYTNNDITVTKAALTITASTANKTYGTALTGAAGSAAFTTSALQNSETVGSVTIAYGTGAAATAAVNTYTGSVTPSVATGGTFTPGNYNITYNAGDIVVGKANLAITANTANKTYGTALTGASGSTAFTSTGLANSETIGSVTLAYGTGAAANAAVNTYTGSVTPSAATGGTFATSNYNITYNSGNIVVGKANLSITATDVNKVYGATLTGAAGSTAFTSTGLVNSETIGSVTVAYGTGSAATAAVNTYTGSVTPSAATGGTFTAGNYNITYNNGNIVVGKANLVITANNVNKVYGATLTGAAGSTAFTSTGLANSETIGSVTIAYGTGSAATASGGTYTGAVVASAATGGTFTPANYNVSYAAGNITVTPVSLTVTATNATKVYGTANPAFAVTYAGFVGADNAASLTTQPTVSTTATTTSGVGTYALTPAGGVSSNYTFVYVPGSLTVTRAALTITADAKTKAYGSANPTLTATYTGFAGTDNAASLTTQPTFATTAVTNSLPGTYPITVSGAVSANYTITYVAGTLTVSPGNNANLSFLTISVGSLSPAFATATTTYTDTVASTVDRLSVTPTLSDPAANLQVNGTQVGSGNSSTFIPLNVGNTTITILVTAQDGTTKNTYTVKVYRATAVSSISATNVMSPNGDGINDAWVIKDINLYPNNNVTVYDRGGRVVYTKHGYTNDWTGTLRGAPLAEGTYYYTVDLGISTPIIKGYITILRTR
ncbi:MBG domain-containing protein [Mucilaginibacter sp. AW1-3]